MAFPSTLPIAARMCSGEPLACAHTSPIDPPSAVAKAATARLPRYAIFMCPPRAGSEGPPAEKSIREAPPQTGRLRSVRASVQGIQAAARGRGRRGRLAHAPGARPDDGRAALCSRDHEAGDVAEGHAYHRGIRGAAREGRGDDMRDWRKIRTLSKARMMKRVARFRKLK